MMARLCCTRAIGEGSTASGISAWMLRNVFTAVTEMPGSLPEMPDITFSASATEVDGCDRNAGGRLVRSFLVGNRIRALELGMHRLIVSSARPDSE